MIRGLVWAQWYFAPDWFNNIEDDDGPRCLEDDSKRQHRAARVLYLGMTLALKLSHLCYDCRTRQFSAPTGSHVDQLSSVTIHPDSRLKTQMSAIELRDDSSVKGGLRSSLRRDGANDFTQEHTRKHIDRVVIIPGDDNQMI
jgi:hypothetical protein